MEQTLEHRIRERAYEIWDAGGRADGLADEHWFAAEREVRTLLTPPPTPKAAVRKPRARTSRSGRAAAR